MVDNTLFEKTHAKITAPYFVPCVVLVARNHEARTEVESFVQQVARYIRNE